LSHKETVAPSIHSSKSECAAVSVQSIPAAPPKPAEETLESLIQADAACVNAVQDLSNLHEEVMSSINLELGIDALECGNVSLGIEALRASAKAGTNAAAFYNLGICYERGIGVEEDRAKVKLSTRPPSLSSEARV
jgi:TPR repeat protein